MHLYICTLYHRCSPQPKRMNQLWRWKNVRPGNVFWSDVTPILLTTWKHRCNRRCQDGDGGDGGKVGLHPLKILMAGTRDLASFWKKASRNSGAICFFLPHLPPLKLGKSSTQKSVVRWGYMLWFPRLVMGIAWKFDEDAYDGIIIWGHLKQEPPNFHYFYHNLIGRNQSLVSWEE